MISERTIEAIRQFHEQRDWEAYHTPENLAKSICIEAAELLECYQWGAQNPMGGPEHVKDELADVLTYCITMADRLGCDMDEIIMAKLKKTECKYPVAEVRGNFKAYARRHEEGHEGPKLDEISA